MEIIFEFILEFILEGSIEISKNQKIPKWLRYSLIIFITLFFLAAIRLILITGILVLNQNQFIGTLFIFIEVIILFTSIIQFRKTYLLKKKGGKR